MSGSYKCKVCGTPATHFSLLGLFKLPFCPQHMQGSLCCIEYIEQVTGAEDFERCRKLGKALELVRRIEDREKWESEEVESRLEKLKKLSIEALLETFEDLAASGKSLHYEFETALNLAKSQLSASTHSSYSPLAALALSSPPCDSLPDLYLRDVRSTVSLIRQIALQSAGFVGRSPEQLLRRAFRRQTLVEPKKYYGKPSKVPVLKESNGTYPQLFREGSEPFIFQIAKEDFSDFPAKHAKLTNGGPAVCRICRQTLTSQVYQPLEGHEDCKICLPCINKSTKTYLKCPLCKGRYPSSVRSALEALIPGLIKSSKRHLPADTEKTACWLCGLAGKPLFHYCFSGQALCFPCCQLITVQSKLAKCGKCGENLSGEVWKSCFEGGKGCLECGSRAKIEEIALVWREKGRIQFICSVCDGKWIEEAWFQQ